MNNELHKKVSIIIPNYNSQEYIAECLDSALNQDYPNLEIIVIDDGSTDDSLEIIKPYLNKIKLITQDNQGACVARNAGLEIATGEYIKFLDSDDYLAPGIISSQVKYSNKLKEKEIIYGDFTLKYPASLVYHHNKSISLDQTLEDTIVTDILTSTPLHRKKYLDMIQGFDIRFKSGQEWNLHIRLATLGIKFIHFPENIYFYRQHNSPDRISIKKKNNPTEELNKYHMTFNSIIITYDNENIRKVFANIFWNLGRNALLENQIKISKQCFNLSQNIYPNILMTFHPRYKILLKVLHYKNIESIIAYRRKFTKFRKKLFKK